MDVCYDENFWIEFEILMYDQDRIGNTKQDMIDVIELLELNRDDRILDLCCGFGRNSQVLADLGFKTTGIDITKQYLDRAITDRREPNNPEYILGDITKFVKPEYFNHVINMFTSFGLLENEEDEIKAISNVYNSLKKGGKYLIDIQGKELLIRDFEERIWFESGNVKAFYEYKILNCFTLLQSRWLYYKDSKMHERSFNTRIYSGVELATMLANVGFSTVEIFGDYKGNPYDINAKRLIAVATK